MTQFWLIGYKESFLGHIFSYVKKKQSLREDSRLPFSNANGVCDASASVDILTSWWCAQWRKIQFSGDGGTDSNSVWFSNFTAATVKNCMSPLWLSCLRIHLQWRRPRFDPWVGKIPWKRSWQPTPVFLPGESHGQRSLAGYSPWGHKRVWHDWATNTFTFNPTRNEWVRSSGEPAN